jgi:hypothetical protein
MVTYEQTLVPNIPEENSRAFVSEKSATDIVMAVASQLLHDTCSLIHCG